MVDEEYDPWKEAPSEVRSAILNAWANGMPPMASALYGRWWQLETWLRSLVYVELRSAFGEAWTEKLPKNSEPRQAGERAFHHMGTPDAQSLLAYTDASALFSITLENWNLFQPFLLPRNVWVGRIEELRAIRNRIGHCRRPHTDDLARLEQTLRDLDRGAYLAAASFNEQGLAEDSWADRVVDSWCRMNHRDASLVAHAERQYDTTFQLRHSRRPWSSAKTQGTISGQDGHIWHAFWYFRGVRPFDLGRFWRQIEPVGVAILMVCMDDESSLSVSFSALEDPSLVADTIGRCFHAALYSIGHGTQNEKSHARLQALREEAEMRVQIGTGWSSIGPQTPALRFFGA